MTVNKNMRPAFESRLGAVRLAIWPRTLDKGTRLYNVRIVRQYQKDGDWHETPTFNGLPDLVHVEEVVGLAKAWILAEQTGGNGHELATAV